MAGSTLGLHGFTVCVQEASLLLPDSPHVWLLALAIAGITADPGLLEFAEDRMKMVDAVNVHGGIGGLVARLLSLATGAAVDAPTRLKTTLRSARRSVVAPSVWCDLARQLLQAVGAAAPVAALLRNASMFAAVSASQQVTSGAMGSSDDIEASVIRVICALLAGEQPIKLATKLVHACPQSDFAWQLLRACKGGSLK